MSLEHLLLLQYHPSFRDDRRADPEINRQVGSGRTLKKITPPSILAWLASQIGPSMFLLLTFWYEWILPVGVLDEISFKTFSVADLEIDRQVGSGTTLAGPFSRPLQIRCDLHEYRDRYSDRYKSRATVTNLISQKVFVKSF